MTQPTTTVGVRLLIFSELVKIRGKIGDLVDMGRSSMNLPPKEREAHAERRPSLDSATLRPAIDKPSPEYNPKKK